MRAHCELWRGPDRLSVSFEVEAEFIDIFEVRGFKRERRGRLLDTLVQKGRLVYGYEGLDSVLRQTCIEYFAPPSLKPTQFSRSSVRFEGPLEPKGEAKLFLSVSCEVNASGSERHSYEEAFAEASQTKNAVPQCEVSSSNEWFNDWANRSVADLSMMVTHTIHGPYPYAGVP